MYDVLRDTRVRKVFLLRRNAVARAVSLAKIHQAGVPWVGSPSKGVRINLDLNSVRHQMKINHAIINCYKFVQSTGQSTILIYYSDAKADLEGTLSKIYDFLGLPPADVDSIAHSDKNIHQQRGPNETVQDDVKNWGTFMDEVKAAGLEETINDMLKYP